MKKDLITEYGTYHCNSSINKVPKFILQCYMKFLGIEIRKGTRKDTLCFFISKYFENEKKSKKKSIPIHKCLQNEPEEIRKNRLCGSKFTEKDWNKMKEKWGKFTMT